ncbi:MAG: ATP-binding protein [Crocinitomicaceae bacterium]
MNQWGNIALKYKYFILACFAFSILFYLHFKQEKTRGIERQNIQSTFLQEEVKMKENARSALDYFQLHGVLPVNPKIQLHIYRNDTLIKWNTNKAPVSNFASIQFPASGLIQLQNGWYYGEVYQKGGDICCASYCISQEYPYENEFISSKPNPIFGSGHFQISLDVNRGYPIFNKANQYCFSLIPDHKEIPNNNLYILPLMVFAMISFLFGIFQLVSNHKVGNWLFLLALLITRMILFEVPLALLFKNASFHSAELFAFNEWFPSYMDFCINSIFIVFGLLAFFKSLNQTNKNWILWLQFFGVFGVWVVILLLVKMVIIHSNIPLNFNQFFALNSDSFVFFSIIGVFFLGFQKIIFGIITRLFDAGVRGWVVFLLTFSTIIAGGFILTSVGFSVYVLLLPGAVLLINHFFYKRKESLQQFSFQLLLLCLFSFVFVHELISNQQQKELENRAIYAKKLATERDVNLEIEFLESKDALLKDPVFHQFSKNDQVPMELASILEKRHFNGIWDGYDLSFDVFSENGTSLVSKDSSSFHQTKSLLDQYGSPSDIEPSMYFIPSEKMGLSYLIWQKIPLDSSHLFLSIRLKSKRIPEEIGFPRLLISEKANVLRELEEYSIAKYAEGRLIHQSGSFNFPVKMVSFIPTSHVEGSFQKDGFNHYFYRKTPKNAIILSVETKSWFDYITSFAYIFCFWGVLSIIIYLLNGGAVIRGLHLSFAFKIQIAFVLVLVLSLLLYGIGSGVFVGKQYEAYTRNNIQDKLSSIQEELRSKIKGETALSVGVDRENIQNRLKKLSIVFHTDLNVYDNCGLLVASSRPKIFDLGLISEQMNPRAVSELIEKQKSSFSHLEEIGNLSFISSYLPIYSADQKVIGFVNLPYFGQQQDYENQIETFVTSIINVFILLLALSVLIGLLVSNWLISPLVLLKKHMSNIQFGKENKHISYQQKDEIGAIVEAYNEKLDELQIAAQRLASTERETAWREMAQQIAHEIKNPLTPMKLSIQHLLRSYDPKKEGGAEQLNRVLHSIIDQVDGLTRMANEFSNFAKMPEPILQRENIVEIVEKVRSLYENEDQFTFVFLPASDAIFVHVDRNLWIQVLVNLIQNAQQAVIGTAQAQIRITIDQVDHMCIIEVSDNGCGISKDASLLIFSPHFTTKSSGSGIGLSLVKQIVEKHGGNISFTSIENQGTTFRIELPTIS